MSAKSRLAAAYLAAVFLLGALPVEAEERRPKSRGFVDGSAFADLADDESPIVEINLRGNLLKAIGSGDTESGGFGDFVRNLESITAYVVGLGGDRSRFERANRMVRDTEARLERDGWERLARVREGASKVNVFIRNDEQFVDGLVVLVVDGDESQVVFVNIAGRIDLARLSELARHIDVPGLDAIEKAPKAEKDD